jgi:Mn2+/Fe2+ NRAMP family transporter
MSVGIGVLIFDFDRTPTIIAAQAVTVVAAPLIAGVLLWLTSSCDVMGDQVNGPVTKVVAGIGLVLLVAMAARTALVTLPASIESYRQKVVETASDSSGVLGNESPLSLR